MLHYGVGLCQLNCLQSLIGCIHINEMDVAKIRSPYHGIHYTTICNCHQTYLFRFWKWKCYIQRITSCPSLIPFKYLFPMVPRYLPVMAKHVLLWTLWWCCSRPSVYHFLLDNRAAWHKRYSDVILLHSQLEFPEHKISLEGIGLKIKTRWLVNDIEARPASRYEEPYDKISIQIAPKLKRFLRRKYFTAAGKPPSRSKEK